MHVSRPVRVCPGDAYHRTVNSPEMITEPAANTEFQGRRVSRSVHADDDKPVTFQNPFAQCGERGVVRVAGGGDVVLGPVRGFYGAC